MSDIKDKNYLQMKSFIERNSLSFQEKVEGTTSRMDVQNGKSKCANQFN